MFQTGVQPQIPPAVSQAIATGLFNFDGFDDTETSLEFMKASAPTIRATPALYKPPSILGSKAKKRNGLNVSFATGTGAVLHIREEKLSSEPLPTLEDKRRLSETVPSLEYREKLDLLNSEKSGTKINDLLDSGIGGKIDNNTKSGSQGNLSGMSDWLIRIGIPTSIAERYALKLNQNNYSVTSIGSLDNEGITKFFQSCNMSPIDRKCVEEWSWKHKMEIKLTQSNIDLTYLRKTVETQQKQIVTLSKKVNSLECQLRYQKPLDSWSVADTCAWIASFGEVYESYANDFRSMQADGRFLAGMSEEDLKDVIDRKIHRRRIWIHLEALQTGMPALEVDAPELETE